MIRSRTFLVAAVLLIAGSMMSDVAHAQEFFAEEFAVVVPRKDPAPIARVKVVVRLTTENVSFTVTNPVGQSVVFGALVPAPAGAFEFEDLANTDQVWVVPPDAALPVADPGRRIYEVYLNLRSDNQFLSTGDCSAITWPVGVADERWTIQADGEKVVEVLMENYNYEGTGGCVEPTHLVGSPAATVDGAIPACGGGGGGARPPLHVALVLDRSGSMNTTLDGSPSAEPKIAALRAAVTDFVDVWSLFRSAEASCGGAPPNDQIGVSLFNSAAQWWSALGAGLHSFSTAEGTIRSNIGSLTAGGSTAMGPGLLQADGALPAPGGIGGPRRVALLMSNGKQNVSPYAAVSGSSVGTMPGGIFTPLPNGGYRIYTVTVGASPAVDPVINNSLASASGGAYTNSVESATIMRPFFLEVLQEALAFATAQTALLQRGQLSVQQGFSQRVHIAGSTKLVSVNMMWPQDLGTVRLTVTPPNGTPITQLGDPTVRIGVGGRRMGNPRGEWLIEADFEDPSGNVTAVPFELMVLTDDAAIKAMPDVQSGNTAGGYAPGEPMLLMTRLTAFGRPVTVLPNGAVRAHVAKPGQTLGDLLAEHQGSTQPPDSARSDTMTPAEARLYHLLQGNPGLFAYGTETVVLRDDGTNGDAMADDGLYSARYSPVEYGHYNILFDVDATSDETGRFQRQHLETAYVRPLPDPTESEVQASVQQGTLVLTIIPRTQFGHLVGPDWQNYFWLTTSGQAPLRPVNNNDGTYTARIPLGPGGGVPTVALHFIDSPIYLDAETRPEVVEPLLTRTSVLLPSVEEGKPRGGGNGPGLPVPGPSGGCGRLASPSMGLLVFGLILIGVPVRRRRKDRA